MCVCVCVGGGGGGGGGGEVVLQTRPSAEMNPIIRITLENQSLSQLDHVLANKHRWFSLNCAKCSIDV